MCRIALTCGKEEPKTTLAQCEASHHIVLPRMVDEVEPLTGTAARTGQAAAGLFDQASLRFGYGDLGGAATALRAAADQLHDLTLLTSEIAHDVERLPDLASDAVEWILPGMAEAIATYDAYFGIRRVDRLNLGQRAVACLPTLHQLADDLAGAAVTPDDAALLAGLATEVLTACCRTTARAARIDREAHRPSSIRPKDRWMLGHRVYAIANTSAERALVHAMAMITNADITGAAAAVVRATRSVRAMTAAIELASAMPAKAYRHIVQPSMAPPRLRIELSSTMNLDHAAYRQALARFLQGHDQELAHARRELLNADLGDLERQVAITYRLVGTAPASGKRAHGGAVAALRRLMRARQDSYADLLAECAPAT